MYSIWLSKQRSTIEFSSKLLELRRYEFVFHATTARHRSFAEPIFPFAMRCTIQIWVITILHSFFHQMSPTYLFKVLLLSFVALVRSKILFCHENELFKFCRRPERPTYDMADVLLSLKHAVLKPSPDPQQMQAQAQNYNHPTQASLSYTVHPQILVSPGQSQAQSSNCNSMNYYDQCNSQHQHASAPPMYPSMSVNVSMNMTMHGYGSESVPMQCSQVNTWKFKW